MSKLALIIILSTFSLSGFATEILNEGLASEVKTLTKELVVETKCAVSPGGHDRETGQYYGPSCSCVQAHIEVIDTVKNAYPTAKEIKIPPYFIRSLSQCTEKFVVIGTVIYTQVQ